MANLGNTSLRPAGVVLVGIICVLALTGAAGNAAQKDTIPDFSGPWGRSLQAFDFDAPPPGKAPRALVNTSGNDLIPVGNYDSPILKPWAAAEVKKHNEIYLAGQLALDAPVSCVPMSVPYALVVRQNVWLLQTAKEVVIAYQNDNYIRHVRLNVPHSAHPKPSWWGESGRPLRGRHAGGRHHRHRCA